MQRRELFRILGAGAMLPALSSDVLAMLQSSRPGLGYKLQTLTPRQNDTVVAMIDQIIPATDTPGAKDARVNEFIDVILSEWATDSERSSFLAGVEDVDRRSNELYGKNFAESSAEQQMTLLRAMDDAAMTKPKPRHHGSVPPEERDNQLQGDFWRVFKRITLHGYYTSEVGFAQELKLQIIPGAQHGCVPAGPGVGEA